jgi:hypothetical protein
MATAVSSATRSRAGCAPLPARTASADAEVMVMTTSVVPTA